MSAKLDGDPTSTCHRPIDRYRHFVVSAIMAILVPFAANLPEQEEQIAIETHNN